MSREIEFRAICVDTNKFVYGFYVANGGYKTIAYQSPDLIGHLRIHEVITDTVGQFTGLLDKNGIKIFEGDLMRNESGRVCEVLWHKYTSSFDCKPVQPITGDSKNSDNHLWPIFMTVIGNIHQNSEQLK